MLNRLSTKWMLSGFLMIIIVLFSLSACSDSKSSGQSDSQVKGGAVVYRDTLNVAIASEATSYDTHRDQGNSPKMVGDGQVFEKLVTLNAAGEVVPELAESWTVSPDGREITFYLRKGVKFHDGTELTAIDAATSMNRWIRYFGIATTLAKEARFVEVDRYTLKINLPNPAAAFVDILAGAAQPATVTTAASNENLDVNGFWKEYIGTGPYKFVEWVQNQYILLEKFDDYVPYGDPDVLADGKAGYKYGFLKKIYYWYVPDPITRVMGLETGQYDAIFALSVDDEDRVKNNPDLEVVPALNGIAYMQVNKKQGPLKDVNLRKAINYMLNNEDLLLAQMGTHYVLDSSYMNRPQYWYSTAGSQYYNQQDLVKAREYLAKSNYRGEPIRINSSNAMATVLQRQLIDFGLNAQLIAGDSAASSSIAPDPSKWELTIGTQVIHPIPVIKPFLDANARGWADDETLQNYITEFYAQPTKEEAKAVWDKIQLYCWEEYIPTFLIGHQDNLYAWNKKLEGVVTKEGIFFWNAKIRQ
ncbi:putative ABC transporter peptide-binding protein [Treponema primitia ZAS-2]|uniref:Putative ABC transporter peptide-binding protein n=1 Tax=Treponema primitia (strain ATCC BAA-887 / DSM 12427 / ZAS-2) TaxID=545694 RepID=F5YK16_TREPZ|nr:ABC transporter substrate-binding protein [Treponema primitia]AEF84085.1 putative ABC transporter peptide-binding protein [Treponema primitia ZAS-2]